MVDLQDARERTLSAFHNWYDHLTVYTASGGPAKGTISAALVVLERLKKDFSLEIEAHRAKGASQIKGVSGAAVEKILARFGENRPFVREGGRTNRGVPGDMRGMLVAISKAELDDMAPEERNDILDNLQEILVEKVAEFHNRQKLKMVYDSTKSTWQNVYDLLKIADMTGKQGPVAQHLVGAKLQLRFPGLEIGNESYSTKDDQLGRHGDFLVGDTVFHVTVAPMQGVYDKSKRNIEEGLRPCLLVKDHCLAGVRQNAELVAPGRIVVESIETFVSQNIEEIAMFSKDKLVPGLYSLFMTYNQRVDKAEIDKSMMIDIPLNLHNQANVSTKAIWDG
ncbi:MAG: DUF4928 family protein [Dethiobacter sp.]|nr:DUF4928 family protein [Dethiobacter sp.]